MPIQTYALEPPKKVSTGIPLTLEKPFTAPLQNFLFPAVSQLNTVPLSGGSRRQTRSGGIYGTQTLTSILFKIDSANTTPQSPTPRDTASSRTATQKDRYKIVR